ncbi:hypothetical protein C8Q80DRAFT_536465 [Daedaleopsis nitida]|nr:hypothetical protein C8Q80DRAFT_536465 [Daedaleopsis nitida]
MALPHLNMAYSPRNFITFPTGGHWPASAHDAHEEQEQDDGWGEGATASGNLWGASAASDRHSGDDWGGSGGGGDDDWGATTGEGWDAPSGGGGWGQAPSGGGGWGQAPSAATESQWGQPPAAAAAGNGLGMYGMARGSSKRGGAHAQSPTTASAQAPASLHPTAAAQMMSPSGWGARPAPAPTGWGQPAAAWGQPAAPRTTAAKPAWANWANEVKMGGSTQPAVATTAYAYQAQPAAVGGGTRQVLSEHQRSQVLSSLLEDPNQQAKGYYQQSQHHRQQAAAHPTRTQQSLHPTQLEAQLIAEQQGIYRSIQDSNARAGTQHGYAQQHGRPQPVQYADSWTHWGNSGWGGDRASTIPEEEEEEYEDEEWEDDEDDGWGGEDMDTATVTVTTNAYDSPPTSIMPDPPRPRPLAVALMHMHLHLHRVHRLLGMPNTRSGRLRQCRAP